MGERLASTLTTSLHAVENLVVLHIGIEQLLPIMGAIFGGKILLLPWKDDHGRTGRGDGTTVNTLR